MSSTILSILYGLSTFVSASCSLTLSSFLDEYVARSNPHILELLTSLALHTQYELKTFPISALRALLNFHRNEFLDNIQKANLFTRRAKHSKELSEVAFKTLVERLKESGEPDQKEYEVHMQSLVPQPGVSDIDMKPPPSA